MTLSLLLGKKILSMALIALVGYWFAASGRFSKADTEALTRLNLFIVCPCAVFNSFQMEFSQEKFSGLLYAIFVAVVVHILYILLEMILRKPLRLSPAESATAIYSNALNLIFPIVAATLSEEMIFYCTAFVLIQTVLLWTHCKKIISGESKYRLKDMLNPNVVGILLGFVFFLCRLQLPDILGTTVANIGSMVGPVSMLSVGLIMGPMDLKATLANVRAYKAVVLRLLVFPVITVLFLRYSGIMWLHPEGSRILLVTTIAAASCCASTVPQQCKVFNNDPEFASALNTLTLFGCIVTMPLIVLLYQVLL